MSSRKEQKRSARETRVAAERAAAAAESRRRLALAGGVALALAVMASAGLLLTGTDDRGSGSTIRPAAIPPQRTTDLGAAVKLAGAKRISYRYEYGINEHTHRAVEYPTNPPTNGPHAFTWTPDGQYAGLPAPPIGEVVHAQEHGRVVIQYRAGIPLSRLRQLVALHQESPYHVLLVENATQMPCEVAATAWGQGVLCPKLNNRSFDVLRAFRDRFRDRGPETVA